MALVALLYILFFFVLILWLLFCQTDLRLLISTRIGYKPEIVYANKVIWVTGCSSGIGEQIAYRLARYRGVKLILTARRGDLLGQVKQNCLGLNSSLARDDVLVLSLDLMDFASYEQAVRTAYETFGRVDVLINNAGRSQRSTWLGTDVAVDEECFKLNALAPTYLSRLVVQRMIAHGGGQVVAVSSLAGIMPAPSSNSYSAAKHALMGYFRCLLLEHMKDNITVTIACPGLVFAPNNPQSAFTSRSGEAHGEVVTKSRLHLDADQCAKWIILAAANKLDECWITKQPVLLVTYLRMYCPQLLYLLLHLFGNRFMSRLREGK